MKINGHILRTGGTDNDIGGLFALILKALNGDNAAKGVKVGSVPIGALIGGFKLDEKAKVALDKVKPLLGGVKVPVPALVPAGGMIAAIEVDALDFLAKNGFPDGPPLGLTFPNPRFETTTGQNGGFSIASDPKYDGVKAHLEIHRRVVQDIGFAQFTHKFPLYRSGVFTLTPRTLNVPVLVHVRPSGPGEGVTQAQVDAQVAKARQAAGLSKLNAMIRDEFIAFHGEKSGATVRFHLHLAPRTASNLGRFIDIGVSAFDLDLPGPDFITGICVSKDEVKKQIQKQAKVITEDVNADIRRKFSEALKKSIPAGGQMLDAIASSMVSLSVHDVRAPIVRVDDVGFMKVEFRDLALDMAIGFPRALIA